MRLLRPHFIKHRASFITLSCATATQSRERDHVLPPNGVNFKVKASRDSDFSHCDCFSWHLPPSGDDECKNLFEGQTDILFLNVKPPPLYNVANIYELRKNSDQATLLSYVAYKFRKFFHAIPCNNMRYITYQRDHVLCRIRQTIGSVSPRPCHR